MGSWAPCLVSFCLCNIRRRGATEFGGQPPPWKLGVCEDPSAPTTQCACSWEINCYFLQEFFSSVFLSGAAKPLDVGAEALGMSIPMEVQHSSTQSLRQNGWHGSGTSSWIYLRYCFNVWNYKSEVALKAWGVSIIWHIKGTLSFHCTWNGMNDGKAIGWMGRATTRHLPPRLQIEQES